MNHCMLLQVTLPDFNIAQDTDGDRDKISESDNGRDLPFAADRRSLALDNSVSKVTTFDDSSWTSASCLKLEIRNVL